MTDDFDRRLAQLPPLPVQNNGQAVARRAFAHHASMGAGPGARLFYLWSRYLEGPLAGAYAVAMVLWAFVRLAG